MPFEGAPAVFPLALLDEGHTGVALFMVLSGYLFAKLLDGKTIAYPAFFWNRFIRLAPLLLLTFAIVGVQHHLRGGSTFDYVLSLARGLVYPGWPNGGWSIAAEIHFYLALPLLLVLVRRSRYLPLLVIVAAIAFRSYSFHAHGQVQTLAYFSILGRIDQFVCGIVAFTLSKTMTPKVWHLGLVLLAFTSFWWWFDVTGGFYQRPSYPSSSPIWIWIPTLEGVAYAVVIAWYDARGVRGRAFASRLLQRLGEYSYSIYLLHFFVVFEVARFIDQRIMDISEFYVAIVWAAGFFVAMIVPGYLSYRFVESPFLKLRVGYIKPSRPGPRATTPGNA